jgi:tetratricopeptide (TPR) repeat protein
MGDGVLIYFGYPAAHEDDAERAVRAGLALIDAVATLPAPEPVQVRIGVATGLVVVGDLVGSGEAQERGIVGETPNLAARLQGIAEPNTVVIAEATRKLLGNLFELWDLGPKELKGIAEPVRAFAALRASSVEGRFEAMHAGGLTALVGREEELELLSRRWAKAKTREGHVVLLSGEAGIGKSRLAAALMEEIAAEPHTRLRYFCSPQHTDSAFYPVVGQFERAAGFAHGDTPQIRLDKLDALLAQTSTSKQDAAALAEMLSLPNDGRYPALDPVPEQRRQKMLEALGKQLETLARSSPVLMIFEDAHWSDPTSLEALGRAVDRVRTLAVLLIVTFRPEFDAPWVGLPQVTSLALNRLGHRDVATMIDRVIGNNPLPANIREDIVERTDGIPLFVEEMTKAVLESGGELEIMRTAAAIPSPALAVPPSLHASLLARLDRLGSAKKVAQIGAALGREFSHLLLSAVVSKSEPELASALDRLTTTGLLFRQGVPPHASYLFKHTLVQDAAYGTLLREPRRALHARIAQTLETQFPEIADTQPELLARHCSEAGLIEKAARLWGKAGQRSVGRSALVEGIEQLKRALALIRKLPGTPPLRREEIKLQVASIGPLMLVNGFAAPETREAIEGARVLIKRAETLGEAPRDPLLLFWVLYSFWLSNYVSSRGDDCCAIASQILSLAEKQPATGPRLIAHRVMGTSLQQIGDLKESQAYFNQSIASFDPAEHRSLGSRFALEKVVSLAHRSLTLWLLGYPATALSDVEQAVHDAQHMGQATPLIIALAITGPTLTLRGDEAFARANSEKLLVLAHEKSTTYFRQFGLSNKGSIHVIAGETDDAIRILTAALAALQVSGEIVWRPWYCANLARAYAAGGQLDDAWRCINEASAAMEETNDRWCEAEIYRTTGEIALQSPQPDEAIVQAYFDRALLVARKQQAKSWELRAAMSMARLWRAQGKGDEARELLAPVYGWFTEGFDTLDLKQAKALLAELA